MLLDLMKIHIATDLQRKHSKLIISQLAFCFLILRSLSALHNTFKCQNENKTLVLKHSKIKFWENL